jgi:hypothetical protein
MKTKVASPENRSSKRARVYHQSTLSVLAASATALFTPALSTANASPTPQKTQQAVTRTAESYARQIKNDYTNVGSKNRRSESVLGTETLIANYNAEDLINHKMGKYVLTATFKKGPHGSSNPANVEDVSIEELKAQDPSVPIYSFNLTKTDNYKYWSVGLVADQAGSQLMDTFSYATGGPHLPGESPLQASQFQLLAKLGSTVLADAKSHVAYTYPVLPFKPAGPSF